MHDEHLQLSPWKNISDTKSIIADCTLWAGCQLNDTMEKPVIASNINVFHIIITNKWYHMCTSLHTRVTHA